MILHCIEIEKRMKLSSIDIIIVNYNSTDYLLKCLASIYGALDDNIIATVYVFDNASQDNIDRVHKKFPNVSLTKNKKNVGFAKAVNRLISRTTASELLILNPDTFINKCFFGTILSFMIENPDVGIVGPKIFEKNGNIQGSARAFPTVMTALFGRNSVMTKFFPNNRLTRKNILNKNSDANACVNVDWVSGACMMVRRKAIEEVGMMDERFFMYWEDADWCQRMIQKDWRIVYFPDASIVHFSGKSSDQNLVQSIIEFHKSAYYFFNKYYPSPFGVLKPLVFVGLCVRVCFVLTVHGIHRWISKNRNRSSIQSANPPNRRSNKNKRYLQG